MDVEWSRTFEGKCDLAQVIDAAMEAGAPSGTTLLVWEFRRASLKRDDITYRFTASDPRDEIEALYAMPIADAHLVIAVFPPETREVTATIHLGYDGRVTRLRVESPSLRILERMRAAIG
ncbi:MAG: hypothetical protein ACFBRM_03655 [Pikeienuella sp.]